MEVSLSLPQARKLVLLSQRIPSARKAGPAIQQTLAAVEHLGYIQIDTISVIQRAHHHTLWNRNPRYKGSHLDKLVRDKKVFEYWSHAAAYLPMHDYRFTLPRKQSLASGEQKHWYKRDHKLMKYVVDRIKSEGPLMAKDFEHRGKKTGDWNSKPAKRALECLFMQGDLMSPYRVNFHKAYDLTERVLPGDIDSTVPTSEDYIRFLITRYLQANGLGQSSDMSYLLKGLKPRVAAIAQEMVSDGELLQVKVADNTYYTLPDSLELLNQPLARSKLKILSPFDNLLIQRKRMQALFGFDYQIECYVPEEKRRYGYFSLPVLWDGTLVARMDCKADRKKSALHINNLVVEAGITKLEGFVLALAKELRPFLNFNDCTELRVHKTSPKKVKSMLRGYWQK